MENEKVNLFNFYKSGNSWVKIDTWIPTEKDKIFKNAKDAIILPVSEFFCVEKSIAFDSYMLVSPKRCYNTDEVRNHICQYLNYFEKYYDTDHELLLYYYRIKQMIDFGIIDNQGNTYGYTKDQFINDIRKYILGPSIYNKVGKMNEANYSLNLCYKNKINEALQYTNKHGKYFMEISVMTNILIPLIMHYMYKNRITSGTEEFILTIYNFLFEHYTDADMYSKLYETTNTTILNDYKHNSPLWNMSAIRGMDTTVNSLEAVNTIIIQVIPKYRYDSNTIMYNLTAIRNMINFTVTGIEYEYDFISLSSSKRDGEDNTSQFDKFEAHLIKSDESLFLQAKFNSQRTMEIIEQKFGPFDDNEIDFYIKELTKNGKTVINNFQRKLISNIFFKYFGDTISINQINIRDYIKLMISAKRLLISSGMIILPYVISSRVMRLATRNSINKKDAMKLETSEYYEAILKKYRNTKIEKQILSTIAIILSSDFDVIDYEDPNLNGKRLQTISDYIIDEILIYVNLI